MTQQNKKFQDLINETTAKNEQLDRELYTAKEILKQYEISKKELVSRLRFELDTVEERYLKVINENLMVGEDFRTRAEVNLYKYQRQVEITKDLEQQLRSTKADLVEANKLISDLSHDIDRHLMTIEDLVGTQLKKDRRFRELKRDKEGVESQLSKLQFKTSRENKQVKEMRNSLDVL